MKENVTTLYCSVVSLFLLPLFLFFQKLLFGQYLVLNCRYEFILWCFQNTQVQFLLLLFTGKIEMDTSSTDTHTTSHLILKSIHDLLHFGLQAFQLKLSFVIFIPQAASPQNREKSRRFLLDLQLYNLLHTCMA